MSPRSEEKNAETRQKTAQNIMQTAFVLFARQGYESTSIAQIAKEAGIAKGLLYNYFKSKEELLEKLILAAMSKGDEIMASIFTEDPRSTLENLFKWYFKELRERPDFWRMITELTFKVHQFKFVHDIAVEKYRGYVTLLESLFEQMHYPNPADEAKLIAAIFDGIGAQYVVIREDYPLDELEKLLVDKYCKKIPLR